MPQVPAVPELGAMLGQMMQNPEIMNFVNKMNNYSQHRDESGSGTTNTASKPEKSSDRRENRRERERIALLSALRPYLSENRCRKIDGIVKMLELMEFARSTHLLDSILPLGGMK